MSRSSYMTLDEIATCMASPFNTDRFVELAIREGHSKEEAYAWLDKAYECVDSEKSSNRAVWGAVALVVLLILWIAFVFQITRPVEAKGYSIKNCITEQRCGGKNSPKDRGPRFGGGVCKIGGCDR